VPIDHQSFTQLDTALALIEQKRPVFFSDRFKRPQTPHGFYDATLDPETARRWAGRRGATFVCIPTGAASRLIVIDVDPRNDGHLWLRANLNRLPQTLVHGTPSSGGLHLFLVDPREPEIRCSQGRIAKGVDVRGNGGSVIFAGPGYSVRDPSPPADMPRWLIAACLRPEPPPSPPPRPIRFTVAGNASPYGMKALGAECAAIRAAPFGDQEKTLSASSFKIGRLVAAGELAKGLALTELIAAGQSMPNQKDREPWRPSDVKKKIERSLENGMLKPRVISHRFSNQGR
jgi:hypothetical protein